MFYIMLLAGCTSLMGIEPINETQITETPTVIVLPTQLSVQTRVEGQACELTRLVTIQTDEIQGDLMSWSPQGDQLAFVQPVNGYSGWYIGNLIVFDTLQEETVFTSDDGAVFGDLTWSLDGKSLAFVSLDQEEGYYTVKVADLSNGIETDVFGEAARTDSFASQKGILNWNGSSGLAMSSICGTDCVRVYQFDPDSQLLTEREELRFQDNTSLVLQNDDNSADGNWKVTVDDNDNCWLTNLRENTISLLVADTEILEIKFSSSSQYLALRTAEEIGVYQLGCSNLNNE